MANLAAPPTRSDRFVVVFQAESIECHSVDDAVAIKNANHLLSNHPGYIFTWREIDRMAEALARYGRPDEAETLRLQSTKLRAAQFLLDTIGYVRITRPPQN